MRMEDLPKVRLSRSSLNEGLLIFRYVRPYRRTFITGLVFISLSSATTMAFPYLLKKLIDSAGPLGKDMSMPGPGSIALVMIGVLSIQMIFSFMRVYLFTYVGEHAVADMRRDIYERIILMPMEFFGQRRVGELSNRISADVTQIQDTVTTVLAEILRGFLTLIIGLGLILFISPRLTLMMLSVIPFIVVFAIFFSRRIRKLARQGQDQLADSGTIVQETIQGISNVKAFTNEWFELGRYTRSLSKVVSLAIRNGRLRGMFVSFLQFSIFGSIVLVVWYGTGLMHRGVLSFGDLTAFVVYTAFVGGTLGGFADLYSQLQKTLGATQRVRELLKESTEGVRPVEEPLQDEYRLRGLVQIQDLSFHYPSRPEIEVIQQVSLRAEPGEQIAIVGPSGSGKTTLASLLLRFYLPDSGEIYFDQRRASEIPLTQLRKQIAWVPQDVLLFGGTIRENIAYGNPHASDREIAEAALQANAHEFINQFPEGYQTLVGERGIKLSGGQRQRVAIARAILKDPVILILDEATSSLDSASEALVQEALANLMRNRTSFVIAHRLSTIRFADKIIVLERGSVRESGTHEELLALEDSLYQQLNRIQLTWD
jgi:ABC-type multidrug transport system fused ATPase/permease subunit